jgi:hypothetical protein
MEIVVMRPDSTTSAIEVNTMLPGIWRRSTGRRRYVPTTSIAVTSIADIQPTQMFTVSLRLFPLLWKKTKIGTERLTTISSHAIRR